MSNGPCVLYHLSHWNKANTAAPDTQRLFGFALPSAQAAFSLFGKAAADAG